MRGQSLCKIMRKSVSFFGVHSNKVKGEEMRLFWVIDKGSRFVIYYKHSPTKFGYNAAELFRSAINLTKKTSDAIATEALFRIRTGI